jgi:hypothetical protein
MVALWHGAFNFTTACIECKTSVTTIMMSVAIMIWALLLVIHYLQAKPGGVEKEALLTKKFPSR